MRTAITMFATLTMLAAPALAGPEWVESINGGNDAGPLPNTSQPIQGGSGPVARIRGTLSKSDDGKDKGKGESARGGIEPEVDDLQDMYLIYIDDPASFRASTADMFGGSGDFDSRLFLFDVNGFGLLANDDTPIPNEPRGNESIVFDATITNASNDGTNIVIAEPGYYLLAITYFPDNALSAGGPIFHFGPGPEISGPDGDGGGSPIIAWEEGDGSDIRGSNGDAGRGLDIDEYIIALNGVAFRPVLIDCNRPGRPDPDGSGDYVLRGFVMAWAVNNEGQEIRWNHLYGGSTVVNYRDAYAWEYNAFAFPVVTAGVGNGAQTGTPGVLDLNGIEYANAFDLLHFDFFATPTSALSGPRLVQAVTDLTLHAVDADLRQETEGPVTTKAFFEIWNGNETKFSGVERCITCWDERPLGTYVPFPNHFLLQNLQTDKGQARIDGIASAVVCDDLGDPVNPNDDVISQDAALLGVAAKFLSFDGGNGNGTAAAGSSLVGSGQQAAQVRYDTGGLPPEQSDGDPRVIGPAERVSATEKGSLLYFSKVEIRWDAAGNVVQDTFLTLNNDYPADVTVQMYFINGDEPMLFPCPQPGWNWSDVRLSLTANQPLYWSALSGQPAGVTPFTALDP